MLIASTYDENLEESQLKILKDSYGIACIAGYICQSGAFKEWGMEVKMSLLCTYTGSLLL